MGDIEERVLRGLGLGVDEVHDGALVGTGDAGVRVGEEVADVGGMPMVAAGKARGVVEALLDDRPFAIGGDDEGVEVDLEAVGEAVVVDLGGEATGADQGFGVEATGFGDGAEFLKEDGGLPPKVPRRPPKLSGFASICDQLVRSNSLSSNL